MVSFTLQNIKYRQNYHSTSHSVWLWNAVYYCEGKEWIRSIQNQIAQEIMWTQARWSKQGMDSIS